MYLQEIRNVEDFIARVKRDPNLEVCVGERALALPVREQGVVVVRAALERKYSLDVQDPKMGSTRLVFVEHLIEKDNKFDFDASLLNKLNGESVKIMQIGHISKPPTT
jgi:hypothetical protein